MGSLPAIRTAIAVICSALASGFQIGSVVVVNVLDDVLKAWANTTLTSPSAGTPSENTVAAIYVSMTASFFVGNLIGACGVSIVSHCLSRRNALILSGFIAGVGGAMAALAKAANSVAVFVIGRTVSGAGMGCSMGIAAMFTTEISPVKYRGRCGAAIGLSMAIGDFFAAVVSLPDALGNEDLWPTAMAMLPMFAFIGAGGLLFMAESPRYAYVTMGNKEKAIAAVTFYQGETNLAVYMADMEKEKAKYRGKMKILSVRQVIKKRRYRKPVVMATLINICMQFGGMIGIMAYSSEILNRVGIPWPTAKLVTMSMTVVLTIGSIISNFLIDRVGRRIMLIAGISGCLVSVGSLMLYTGVISWATTAVDIAALQWLCVLTMNVFVLCFGLQECVVIFITTELFDQASRDAAVTLATSICYLATTIASITYGFMLEFTGVTISLVPFLTIPLICLIYIMKHLPETKGRRIADIIEDDHSSLIAFEGPGSFHSAFAYGAINGDA